MMGDAFWAARQGDALLHTSFIADVIGSVVEIGLNMAFDALCVGILIGAGFLEVGSLGCGTLLVVGIVTGVALVATGVGEKFTQWGEAAGNWLSPPTIQGYILTGSDDTRTNSKPAARAAATAISRQDIEEMEEVARREAEEEKKKEDTRSFWDVAGEYLDMAVSVAALPLTAPAAAAQYLTTHLNSEEGRAEMLNDAEKGLAAAGHFVSEMWQPTVAQASPGSKPKPNDKIDCHKHPSSFSQFLEQKQKALEDDPVGTALGLINPLGMLETAFQAVNGLIGSVSNLFKSSDEPPAAEYIAEGARDVRINSQPAARSGVRCTCEAKVVDEPESGKYVSPDVRIGGPLLVVRDIKSGKSQITLVATIILMALQPGRALSKLVCFASGVGLSLAIQMAGNAIKRPVNAATGAKYLADEDDFDFSLPGHYPLDWQRTYSSRDERTEGMFGQGWSTLYEVSLERTPDNPDDNCMTYVAPMGRRIDLQAVEPGRGFYSPGEGLAVRRNAEGHWLISSDDGIHRLFEADPHNPQCQRLKMLGDRNSNCLFLSYDEQGRLVQISGEQQRPCIQLHYEQAEHPRRVTRVFRQSLEGGPELLRSYRYDAAGQLNGVYDSAGQMQREFAYGDHHCMTMHRTAGGERYYYGWAWFEGPDDVAWRVTEHHTDSGEYYRLDWRLNRRMLTVTDSLGRTRRHWWDAKNQVTRYQDASGQFTEFAWDNEERLLTGMTDAQGGRWRYVYDRMGHLTETHDPLGRVEQTQWHPVWHQPETAVDATGAAWRYDYDERGNLVTVTDPLQQRTQYQYDRHGQVVQIRDARDGNKYLRWNEDGQLLRHTDCSGSQTAWFYNTKNQLERATDAEGNSTRYEYNSAGRLVRVVHQDGRGEQFEPDAAGRLVAYTSPTGQITRYRRDSRGLVVSRTDSMSRRTGFEYDAYGRLMALVNENGERYGFRYDEQDRVTEQTDLDGRRQRYGYNASGAVTETVFAAGSHEALNHRFERDAVGRLTAKETPESRTEYDYDAADRLLEIRRRRHDAPEGEKPEVIRFSYDSVGNLLGEGTVQGVLGHTYDELGNRTSTTLPDGRTLRHLYYGSGHLQQINLDREVISELTRDHLHREVLRSQGKLDTRRLYDATGRLKRKETCRGMRGVVPDTFIDRQYAYNGQNELISKKHTRQGETDYFYDTTGRITACRNEAYLDSWQYDAAANLLDRRSGEGATEGNIIPFNRITSYRGLHYRYDGHGRTVEKQTHSGTQRYRYDAEHRLTEVNIIRGGMVQRYGYVYDALGRRVEKHQLDAEGKPYNRTKFLWDGMRLAQEFRPEGSSSLYIYSDQGSYEPLARVDRAGANEPDTVLYYHTDVNGAPEELTDGEGNLVWEANYQVWGNVIREVETRPLRQNLRYQGQYLDRETGLHYNLNRYFDPDIGKFLTSDPIGLAGGLNQYAYAPNPLSWIDPFGLTAEEIKLNPGEILVNPKDINFSQTTINGAFDTPDGKRSVQSVINDVRRGSIKVTDFPAIKVVNVKGQLVVRDGNSRLAIAVKGKAPQIKVIIETDVNQLRDFTSRLRKNGLPNTGTSKTPTCK